MSGQKVRTPPPPAREGGAGRAVPTRVGGLPARARTPLIVAGSVAFLILLGWVTTPKFVTFANALTIVRSASIIGIVAVAMTFVTISGKFFSLSVGETAALSAIAFCGMMSAGWGVAAAVAITILIALVLGALQGGLVAAGANPIITTLGGGAVLYGLAAVLTDNRTVRIGTDAAEWIGRGRPLGVPNQTWTFILITMLAAVVLARTPFGRRVTLVGANAAAAAASGIRRWTTVIGVFALTSVAAGMAGIFTASQVGQGITNQFPDLNINVIAAVLVGGTNLFGGEGSMSRTALGAVFIAALQNLMVIRGFSFGVRMALVGLAVLVGVSVFTLVRRRSV
jgi:ribose transport system permease protein